MKQIANAEMIGLTSKFSRRKNHHVNFRIPKRLILSDMDLEPMLPKDIKTLEFIHSPQSGLGKQVYVLTWNGDDLATITVSDDNLIRHPEEALKADTTNYASTYTDGEVCRKLAELAFDQLLGGTAVIIHGRQLPEGTWLMKEVEKMARFLSEFIGRDSYTYDRSATPVSWKGEIGMLRLKISLRANADNHVIWFAKRASPKYVSTMVGLPTMTSRQVLHSFVELYDARLFDNNVPVTVIERDMIHECLKTHLEITTMELMRKVHRQHMDILVQLVRQKLVGTRIEIFSLWFSMTDEGRTLSGRFAFGKYELAHQFTSASRFIKAMVPEAWISPVDIPKEMATYRVPDYQKFADEIVNQIQALHDKMLHDDMVASRQEAGLPNIPAEQ